MKTSQITDIHILIGKVEKNKQLRLQQGPLHNIK